MEGHEAICFLDLLSQFLRASQWVTGPQIISLDLEFIDLASQREGELSQSQFPIPKESSSWVSSPVLINHLCLCDRSWSRKIALDSFTSRLGSPRTS